MGIRVYLVQHGEAVPETEDPERPLTAKGKADIARLADFLGQCGVRVGRVVHSDKQRARDSAAMLIDKIGAGAIVEELPKGLAPKDSPEYFVDRMVSWAEDTLVVGHQPFISRLVSRIVLGKEVPAIVDITPGTLVLLSRRPATRAWFVAGMVQPDLLAG